MNTNVVGESRPVTTVLTARSGCVIVGSGACAMTRESGVIVRKATTDKVLEGLKSFAGKGKVFQTSLSKDEEASLQQALEAA